MRTRISVPACGLLTCALSLPAIPAPARAQVPVPCPSVSPVDSSVPADPLVGTTHGGSFYAGIPQTVPIGVDIKVVVRVTGSGPLHISAIGPNGLTIAPDWLEYHGPNSSSWSGILPGDEWGSGWTFTVPGCWDLHVEREGVTGDIYVNAVAPVLRSFAFRTLSAGKPAHTFRSNTPITFAVRLDYGGAIAALLPSGTVTVTTRGKPVRTLTLRDRTAGRAVLLARTRLRVTSATAFTATVHLDYVGRLMTRTVHFRVLPAVR